MGAVLEAALGCRQLKVQPGLKDPFPRWFAHVAIGRRPQFLTTGVCPEDRQLGSPHNMAAGFPQDLVIKRQRKEKAKLVFMTKSLK